MAHRKLFKPRFNRAVRFAPAINFAVIGYAPPVHSMAINQRAIDVIDRLSPRARRVLSFFAALHRVGRMGFWGTEATYKAVAAAVRRATREKCKLGIFKLAVKELKEAGLLSKEWGTELTERDSSGNWRPRTKEIAPGEHIALRVRILMLTEEAISLWSKPRKPIKGTPDSLSQKVTADVNPKQCFKTHAPRGHAGDHIKGSNSETSNPDKKEIGGPPATDQTLGESSTSGGRGVVGREASKQRSDATRQQGKGIKAKFGPSSKRPETPGRAAGATWTNNRSRLLAAIWSALRSYPQREADLIFSRATQETDRHWPRSWPACLPWQYWIGRWRDLAPGEVRRTLNHIVLPALKNYALPATTGEAARRVSPVQTRSVEKHAPRSNSATACCRTPKPPERLAAWLQIAVQKLKDRDIL